MGYHDFVARFGIARFDRSSFGWLGPGLQVDLPLSVAVRIPDYALSVTIPAYTITAIVPNYSTIVTVPEYSISMTVPKRKMGVDISS